MTKFSKHKWWIVTALITAPLIAIAAVPNMFSPNTLISSSQVNANFAALDTRLAALEAASAKSGATTILNNSPGPLSGTGVPPKTATFTASGQSPVVLLVSGSGYVSTGGNPSMDIGVQFDGAVIGHLLEYTNEFQSHKAFPMRAFVVPTPAAGTHTVGLAPINATTDANDFFSVTVIELH